MKNIEKGSASITILILIIIVIGLVSTYYFLNKKQTVEPVSNTAATSSVNLEPKPETKKEEMFVFSEFVPPNQNMDYRLIKLSDLDYELHIDGFQTLIRIKAYLKMAGHDSLNLVFDSYTDDNIGGSLKKGDILFTFTAGDTDNSLIVLNWNKLKPIDPQNDKTTVFIKK